MNWKRARLFLSFHSLFIFFYLSLSLSLFLPFILTDIAGYNGRIIPNLFPTHRLLLLILPCIHITSTLQLSSLSPFNSDFHIATTRVPSSPLSFSSESAQSCKAIHQPQISARFTHRLLKTLDYCLPSCVIPLIPQTTHEEIDSFRHQSESARYRETEREILETPFFLFFIFLSPFSFSPSCPDGQRPTYGTRRNTICYGLENNNRPAVWASWEGLVETPWTCRLPAEEKRSNMTRPSSKETWMRLRTVMHKKGTRRST